jgi:hypothetical protein
MLRETHANVQYDSQWGPVNQADESKSVLRNAMLNGSYKASPTLQWDFSVGQQEGQTECGPDGISLLRQFAINNISRWGLSGPCGLSTRSPLATKARAKKLPATLNTSPPIAPSIHGA